VGEKAMRFLRLFAFMLFLSNIPSPLGFCQLRNFSEYTVDRINTKLTQFSLHDSSNPEFIWASEWTFETATFGDGKSAIFIWYFKDGSKAYSQQGEGIGEIGKNGGYLLSNTASNLEDIHRKKIQPLTLDNYPVKVELWVGEIGDSTGYSPEIKGDEACFNAPGINYKISYYFSACPSSKSQ
jgi:hypothetical protein